MDESDIGINLLVWFLFRRNFHNNDLYCKYGRKL